MKNGLTNLNVCICISGGGTTMQEVLRASKDGRLPRVNSALIISSRPDAGGIGTAHKEGIPEKNIVVLSPKDFGTQDDFGEAILKECWQRKIDLIAQCGWLPYTPPNTPVEYRSAIFNQHPGPLDHGRPDFGGGEKQKGMYGKRVHHAVLYFAMHITRPFWETEATVHRVTSRIDDGGILGRIPVEIKRGDDAYTLAARVLPHEHLLVIDTIKKFTDFGEFREIPIREEPIVRSQTELLILNRAKKAAAKAFPHG